MSRSRVARSLTSTIAFSVLAAIPAVGVAQSSASSSAPAKSALARGNSNVLAVRTGTMLVSTNPLGLVFGVISADVERVAGEQNTLGAAASLYKNDSFTYLSADAKYRYYLNGTALRGFSMAGSAGLTHLRSSVDTCDLDDDFDFECSSETETGNALGVGVDLSYQWLLGARKNIGVNLGIGAKRLIVIGTEVSGASLTLPTARLGVGYAY